MNAFHDAHHHRPTSFYIEDILLNKPKTLYREYPPLASIPRAPLTPLADYAHSYVHNPALLHQHVFAGHPLAPKLTDNPFLVPAPPGKIRLSAV